MSEGGKFPWKFRKIFQVPGGKKERLRESLPKPPDGMAWLQQKETREWKLVPEENLMGSEITQAVTNGNRQAVAKEDEADVTVDFFEGDHHEEQAAPADPFANPFNVPESPPATTSSNDAPSREPEMPLITTDQLYESPRSSTTGSSRVVLNMPSSEEEPFGSQESKSADEEADWEMLSDRVSLTPNGIAFVSRAGSISSHNTNSFSASYKLQRTYSSSTIDSHDLLNLGPSGKGVLGVDYVEHVILSTDTLQGICLAYKLNASRLKRANHFSGETLLLAPKCLIIPISKKAMRQGYLRVQDTDSKEYKMHAIQAEFPRCGLTEAKAYLELADWVLRDAIQSAREDYEWESNLKEGELRAGEIRVMMNVEAGGDKIHFAAQGAGFSPPRRGNAMFKPVDPKAVHAKDIKLEDMHSAAPQHNSFGVEMQSLSKSKASSSS